MIQTGVLIMQVCSRRLTHFLKNSQNTLQKLYNLMCHQKTLNKTYSIPSSTWSKHRRSQPVITCMSQTKNIIELYQQTQSGPGPDGTSLWPPKWKIFSDVNGYPDLSPSATITPQCNSAVRMLPVFLVRQIRLGTVTCVHIFNSNLQW